MNTGPMTSPEEAAKKVRELLSSYIHKHKEIPSSAWLVQANAGLTAFNSEFPEPGSPGAKPLNLDALKKHVLTKLAPTFVVFFKWIVGVHGSSTLRTDLENAASSWKTQYDYDLYAAQQTAVQALREKAEAEAAKNALLLEKAEVEAAKNTLLLEKAEAQAKADKLAEEKAASEADSERAKQMLVQRLDAAERALAELKERNSGTVDVDVAALTQKIATLQMLNTSLIERERTKLTAKAVHDAAPARAQDLPLVIGTVAIATDNVVAMDNAAAPDNTAANESTVAGQDVEPKSRRARKRVGKGNH